MEATRGDTPCPRGSDGFPLESAGPVFCAGITMFSPLTNYGADKVTFKQI